MTASIHTETDRDERLTIRVLSTSDQPAVRRLAERDSSIVPAQPLLGAEIAGELIAAISLADAEARPLADPFVGTAQATALLELRAAQLRATRESSSRGLRARLPRRGRRRMRRAHASLAGSPPGGNRLLRL